MKNGIRVAQEEEKEKPNKNKNKRGFLVEDLPLQTRTINALKKVKYFAGSGQENK